MLVKFFKNKNGGSAAGIDYLLNKRVEQGTANLLKGNATVTRKILRSLTKKQKLCIGCLSFEEKDIDLDIKQKIIDEFERLLFGEYKERFNILWVQHVDKGRLELNFAIPKIDLESGMSFNPYYDKVDRALIDAWQNLANSKFNFTDPKDPAKVHMLQGSKKELKLIKDYIELEKILTDKFINQEFTCRDDILNALKSSDIDITRIGKDYISVKLPNSKKAKRFKGDMFSEEFRDFESLDKLRSKAEARAAEFANTRNAKRDIKEERRVDALSDRNYGTGGFSKDRTSKEIQGGDGGAETKLSPRDQELERLTRELNRQIQKRDRWLAQQASKKSKKNQTLPDICDNIFDANNSIGSDNMESVLDDKEGVDRKEEFNDSNSSLANERTNNANTNDFRATIIRGIREKREQREQNQRTLEASIASLNELCKQTSDEPAGATKRIKELISSTRGAKEGISHFSSNARGAKDAANELKRRIKLTNRLTERISEFINNFKEGISKLREFAKTFIIDNTCDVIDIVKQKDEPGVSGNLFTDLFKQYYNTGTPDKIKRRE